MIAKEATMRAKKKRKSVQPKPATQDALAELCEILRALEEKRMRRVVVGQQFRQYPATPLWIEPSPQGPFTDPACNDLLDGVFSMA
jgi:hypothetical protein